MGQRKSSSGMNSDEGTATALTNLREVGAILRSAREDQGMSVHHLAQALHMGDEQLEALEAGRREELTEAVFIRAAVRRVAGKLGVTPDPLIAALQSLNQGMRPSPPPAPTQPAAPKQRDRHQPRPARPIAPMAMGCTALGLGLAGLLHWSQALPALRAISAPPAPPKLVIPTPRPQATATLEPLQTTQPTQLTQRPTRSTVTIRTSQPSWIALRDRSGQMLFEGMVTAEKSFPASEGLEIYAGRPDLVTVDDGGDNPGPLGSIDQVRWYQLSATPAPAPATQAL